jgi:two-component system chemotaxis response regulator CheY
MSKILIADDSSTARMYTRRCLEICGLNNATFAEAADGREALDMLKTENFDLLVTDITMPIMDGMELLAQIYSSPKLNHIPVLVITSADNPTRANELNLLGVKSVLSKPVNPPAMLEVLNNMGIIQSKG